LLHRPVVLDFGLKPDELQGGLTDLKDWEIEGFGHLLDPFHDLPVGDLGPGFLELRQLDGDIETGNGLEVEALGPEEVKGVIGVVTSLNDTHFEKRKTKIFFSLLENKSLDLFYKELKKYPFTLMSLLDNVFMIPEK